MIATIIALGGHAGAQSRPLAAVDPEPVGDGKMSIDLGVDYWSDARYPLSGLGGNLVRLGVFNLNFGVGRVADILLAGGVHNRLFITSRDPTGPHFSS
jgi:hypothetical protein